ncbi:MAG: hypothetical protein KBT34_08225 [Prevotella sp.]|nr:hypothetical protein [Candidatus Prevotella equi]
MKKFTIIHNFTATASIDVLAETREEAFAKAAKNELELTDYDFELDSAEIGHEEDVPDLQETIDKATTIIKKFCEGAGQDDFYSVPCYPTITTQVWNGDEYIKHKNTVEDFYYDSDKGLMMDVGEVFEVELSELSDVEQLNVCQVIINAAPNNGIEL